MPTLPSFKVIPITHADVGHSMIYFDNFMLQISLEAT